MSNNRIIRIVCKGTKITGMSITGVLVESEFNRLNVIKAIQNNDQEMIETVWKSITENRIKGFKFKWDGTWEDGKDRSDEIGDGQYFLRMCLNCGKRAGMHISNRCLNH